MGEEKTYKIGEQFKEVLMLMLSKSVMTAMACDPEAEDYEDQLSNVYSVDDELGKLNIGIADNGELLILNPPSDLVSEEVIKSLQDRAEDIVINK
jgi:hypothetical protein